MSDQFQLGHAAFHPHSAATPPGTMEGITPKHLREIGNLPIPDQRAEELAQEIDRNLPPTQEKVTREYAHSEYMLGVAIGVEQVAGNLRRKSGEAYSEGRDELAKTMRALANEFEEMGRLRRKQYAEYRKENNLPE